VAPKNGRYNNLEVDLAHDMGILEERQSQQSEVQDQHGGMLTQILGKLDRKEALCKKAHEAFLRDEIQPAVEAATGPVEVIKRWGANPLVWAVLIMAGLFVGAIEEWVRYTYNVANENRTRVRVVESTIQQIPARMQEQNAKIDKILTHIRKKRRGGNP
jgi:hypothetical protein